MSKPREAHSILENSDMSREKVVAAEEKLFEISVLYVEER
jgi:hypothetical protein